MKAELLFDARAMLGEGPTWDERSQTLYWVDIMGKRVWAGTEVLTEWDDVVGCVVPSLGGPLIVATRSGIARSIPRRGRGGR